MLAISQTVDVKCYIYAERLNQQSRIAALLPFHGEQPDNVLPWRWLWPLKPDREPEIDSYDTADAEQVVWTAVIHEL